MTLNRRLFLTTTAALLASPAFAQDLLTVLRSARSDPIALTIAAAKRASRQCRRAAFNEQGFISHALIALIPGLEISKRLRGPRQLIPASYCALYAHREARGTQNAAPVLLTCQSSACSADAYQHAFSQGDTKTLRPHLHQVISRGDLTHATSLLCGLAMRDLNHMGHGAIAAAHGIELASWWPEGFERLAPALDYLTSWRKPDDTDARVAQTRGAYVQATARALGAGKSPPKVVDELSLHALRLLSRTSTGQTSAMHMLTSTVATRSLCQFAQKHGAPPYDAATIALRSAAWLDMANEGVSELGPLKLLAPIKPAPKASMTRLHDALKASDSQTAGAIAMRLVRQNSPDLWPALIEQATAAGTTTVQHSIKLIAAALRVDQLEQGPDRGLAAATVARYATATFDRPDPQYEVIVKALGLPPHQWLAG